MLSPMNQQIEVFFKASYPVSQIWHNPFEMQIVSDLPNVLSCHHKNFHEHWFFPIFLSLCDNLQSVSCCIPTKVKATPALTSKTTMENEMFQGL